MNKQELIAHIAAAADLTKAQAARALEAATDAIRSALAEGEEVALIGFGTFSVAERAGREGRNPATGESITIPASRVPKFKPGKALKEAVN